MTGELVELDGVAWCVTHDDTWHEGSTECRRAWIDADLDLPDRECVEVPLFRGVAEGEE